MLLIKLKHLTCKPPTTFLRHFSHFSDSSQQHRFKLPTQDDPHSLLKEDPIQVLSDLWVKTYSQSQSKSQKPFYNLTGFLSKLDLWVLAYQRSCAYVSGTFPPRNAVQGYVLSDLLSLRKSVVHGDFVWNCKTQQLVRGPNEKPITKVLSKRKLNEILNSKTPPFQDRIVQEVLLMILEPIFEPHFSVKSHAFRPGRNAHTALRTIRSNFAGYLWFLKGDISEIFEHTDIDVLMGFVEKHVKDKKVLKLIKSGLRGGMNYSASEEDNGGKFSKKKRKKGQTKKRTLNENEPKPDPYWLRTFFDFAPEEAAKVPYYGHCGILSPLLANLCLNELDHMMEDRIVDFFRPSEHDPVWKYSINDSCHNPAWPEFVPSGGKVKTMKMDYIRFGGYFLVGVRAPREEAVRIKMEIVEFCESKFGTRLDNSKFEIEHISRGIQFLDHILSRRVIYPTLRYTGTGGNIVSEKGVGTLLSVTASLPQCIRRFRQLQLVKGDRDPEPLPCTPMLYSGQAHTNAQMNKFLETMADWYRFADNRKKIIGFCAYVIRSSLGKLYAARYRLKSRAKVYKIATRNLSRPLIEKTNNAAPEYSDLLRMGAVDVIEGVQFSHMSLIPSCDYTPFPRNWVPDHERVLREYVKLQDPNCFYELNKSVKRQGFTLPQDEISEIVWGYKVFGRQSFESKDDKEEETLKEEPKVLAGTEKALTAS